MERWIHQGNERVLGGVDEDEDDVGRGFGGGGAAAAAGFGGASAGFDEEVRR
jgi:hypothetical protein